MHQVYDVAMNLLKEQYPLGKTDPSDIYSLMIRMGILTFIADLQPALERKVEENKKISDCGGIKSEVTLLLEERERAAFEAARLPRKMAGVNGNSPYGRKYKDFDEYAKTK